MATLLSARILTFLLADETRRSHSGAQFSHTNVLHIFIICGGGMVEDFARFTHILFFRDGAGDAFAPREGLRGRCCDFRRADTQKVHCREIVRARVGVRGRYVSRVLSTACPEDEVRCAWESCPCVPRGS